MTQPVALSQLASDHWGTERDSAAEIDRLLTRWSAYFAVYREVQGRLLQPRVLQGRIDVRIDRVLVPKQPAVDGGWAHGAVGIELKRSDVPLGPAIAQAIDYSRSAWRIRGVWLLLDAVFLWPVEKQMGPLASLMVDNRVGSLDWHRGNGLRFALGEEVILRLGIHDDAAAFICTDRGSGRHVGSR